METKRFLWLIVVLLMVSIIVGCGGAATPTAEPAQPAQPAAVTPAEATEPATEEAVEPSEPEAEAVESTGITLKLIDTSEAHGFAFQSLAEKYEQMTGTKLEVEILPYEATYEKEVLTLSTGGSDYDLIIFDCIWGTQYQQNNWLLDIAPYSNNPDLPKLDVNGFVPGLLDAYQVRGEAIYGIPVDFTTILMAYRTDLFEEAGLDGPPKTWAEFADYAEKLTKDTDGDGKIDQYGFIWAGGIPDSAVSEWTLRMQGFKLPEGQDEFWFNKDVTKTVYMNYDYGVESLQLLLDNRQYAPPGASGLDYGGALQAFSQGEGAMFMSWQVYFFEFDDPTKSQVAGKVAYAALPIQEEQNFYVGGWQMGINHSSQHPEEAYKFLAWIGSDEGQEAMLGAGSVTPYKEFVFKSDKWLEQYPVVAATGELLGGHAIPLPLTPHYVEAQQLMFEQLQAAFTDEKTAKEALQQAADEVDALLQK